MGRVIADFVRSVTCHREPRRTVAVAHCDALEVSDPLRTTLSVGYTVTAPRRTPVVSEPTEVGTVPATDEPVLRSVSGAKVKITGKAHVGARLTASFSSTPRVETSVVWTRGTKVVGRGTSYTVMAAGAGARVTATATRPGTRPRPPRRPPRP